MFTFGGNVIPGWTSLIVDMIVDIIEEKPISELLAKIYPVFDHAGAQSLHDIVWRPIHQQHIF